MNPLETDLANQTKRPRSVATWLLTMNKLNEPRRGRDSSGVDVELAAAAAGGWEKEAGGEFNKKGAPSPSS